MGRHGFETHAERSTLRVRSPRAMLRCDRGRRCGRVSASNDFLRELIQDAAQRLMEFDRQAIDPGDRSYSSGEGRLTDGPGFL